jgi:hypothetical protein
MVIIHTTISHNETVTITVAPLGVVRSVHSFPEHKARVVLSLTTQPSLTTGPWVWTSYGLSF